MRLKGILIMLLLLIVTAPLSAQDTPTIPENVDTSAVTDDAVNAIAQKLYCPVCENIPLDACGTPGCQDWRNEIRGMLAVGMSEEEIIDNFVTRFGDRVVGTPRDPLIAAISIVVPWLFVLVGLAFAFYIVSQWRRKSHERQAEPVAIPAEKTKRDSYLEQLEKDLAG